MKKCKYLKCQNLVEENRTFCSHSCQRQGRDMSHAFGNRNSEILRTKSIKMADTKKIVNKLRDKSEFNVFAMWEIKYGIEKATELEKKRREKEWNTKLQNLDVGKFGKFLYSSKAELTLRRILDEYQIKYKTPARISKWVVDFHLTDINLFVQVDGVFFHGIDKPLSTIKELSNSRQGMYRAVYDKFLKDRALDAHCINNKIKLCRITDLEMSSLNFVNCWNGLRDQDATTNQEIEIVNALKNLDMSKSAAKLLRHNGYGEGSTTIEITENQIVGFLEESRVDFISLITEKIEKRSTIIKSEDIVLAA